MPPSLGNFVEWRVRKGPASWRFSDGLVVQGGRPGVLELFAFRLARGRASPDALSFLGTLAAACASEGIRRDTGVVSWLHWPDLVTIDGRVVARATLSLAPAGDAEKTRVTMGVSVDCFARISSPFSSAGMPTASLRDVLGVEIDIDLLRDKILHALDWYYAEWERGVHRKLAERIQPTIVWLGRIVEVRTHGGVLRGRARGLDDLGSLLLEERDRMGTTRTVAIHPGSVELVKAVR
jgi:BirA family transcriptional regulator, biotin operon repressor / biotin---[acetyl-CoA-carboxylase] ligase